MSLDDLIKRHRKNGSGNSGSRLPNRRSNRSAPYATAKAPGTMWQHDMYSDHSEGEMRDKRDRSDRLRESEKYRYKASDRDDDGDRRRRSRRNRSTERGNLGRSEGVYIPPFKLARSMEKTQDHKSSVEYQRLTWDALRKSINGLVNKVNSTNIKNFIPELFAENLIRGRGIFCRSCMKSQMASPGFTDVFAALVAIVNTKFPMVGELLLRRIVSQLKRAYKRNDKPQLSAGVKFVAHFVNLQVAHEVIALELLTVLSEKPTDDSVEVAVGFVTECGLLLQDLSPKGLHGIFERYRGILHEGKIDKRVQFLIEGLFAIRKAKFQGYPAVCPELDLVEQEDQLTHEISLQDEIDPETTLDIFKEDPQFLENEKHYEEVKKTILGEESKDGEGSDAGSGDEEDDKDDDDESDVEDEEQMKIQDETDTNLINIRRTIYQTMMSSKCFEEAGHKLLKIKLDPGQEMVLCKILLECCSQNKSYEPFYGLLGQRFCMIKKVYRENFDKCFVQQYSEVHRLETNKLHNVAKFFAHLLSTDALPWHVLAYIRITKDTTSLSRIFIKYLFQVSLQSPSKGLDKFKSVFKISRKTFDYICSLVKEDMTAKQSNFTFTNGKPVLFEDQVAVALRRLSSGQSLVTVGESFGLHHSTVLQLTWRFVEAMEERGLHHLQWPSTKAEMTEIKSKFERIQGLPNCCGVIDTTHVMMCLASSDPAGKVWLDHEKNHSMVLQAIVDPDMRFRDIVTGWPGKIDDWLVFHSSNFYKLCDQGERLNEEKLVLPEGSEIREYIIGDLAYPLLPYLVIPYEGKEQPELRAEFNKRHSATRLVAHRALARLKEMWKIIQGVMWRPDKHKLPRIILVCCLLHNIVIDLEDAVQDEMPLSHEHDSGYRQRICGSVDIKGVHLREKLSVYLSGKMPP